MRDNPVKRRLAAGEVVLGAMVWELMTPALFPVAERAGAEFVLLDMEHKAWSLETMATVIASGRGASPVPLVRVPDAEYDHVARTLDAGALGVMIASCETEEEALAVVEWAKYPPLGRRGFGIPRYDLEPEGIAATLEKANAEQMVILQIESAAGVESADRIAAVDGVDLLWVGHNDLSTSLGIPGEFEHPLFERAIDRTLAAGEAAGKPLAILVGSVEDGRRWLDRGFRCLAYGLDVQLYEDALSAGLAQLDELRNAL